VKRSKFSLSHYKFATCNMGELVPVGLVEVLPGDTVQQATSMLVRVSPLNTPVMHPCLVRIHHWYVPHRLVWDDWEDFITGGEDGADASAFPTITVNTGTGWAVKSLADYLGVPTTVDDLPVSALPFRAYAMIWNEWYRDQQLQTALTIDTSDGADTTTNTALQFAAWEKDYFTTCRPQPQLGSEVTLPLGTTATVKTNSTDLFTGASNTGMRLMETDGTYPASSRTLSVDNTGQAYSTSTAGGTKDFNVFPSNLYADLSNATAASINDLRQAFALQQYAEARNLYGGRYTEYLRYLGIRPSDARLQRPEYLGGGRQTLQFSEVLQTGVTTAGSSAGVGNMLGHGIGALRSNRYRRYFEEHGYVISLMSVLPKTMYAQGLPRTWSRTTKEDFFQKELQHIGQQEVLYKELYAGHATPTGTFGYQDRYDDYRRMESSIAGEFRTTLNTWHMGRIFSSDPALNAAFVKANPTDRVYQSTSTNQLLVMANHSIQARRMLSSNSKPGMRIL